MIGAKKWSGQNCNEAMASITSSSIHSSGTLSIKQSFSFVRMVLLLDPLHAEGLYAHSSEQSRPPRREPRSHPCKRARLITRSSIVSLINVYQFPRQINQKVLIIRMSDSPSIYSQERKDNGIAKYRSTGAEPLRHHP